MFYKRAMIYFVTLILTISLTGCGPMQKKFVRKKKNEEKIAPVVVTTYDYSKELRVEELYKKYFLFWKSWQTELIDRMDASHKKRIECYDFTVESLLQMKKYLSDAKGNEFEHFISEIKSIDPDIRKQTLSKSEKYRFRQLLENTKRKIDKQFSYPQVKDYLAL